jgi:hypothetical protein
MRFARFRGCWQQQLQSQGAARDRSAGAFVSNSCGCCHQSKLALPYEWRISCFLLPGLGTTEEVFSMCDYSLHNVKSRPAKVGDKLTTHNFNTGTRGFAAPEDVSTAVCVLPGTELAFASQVRCGPSGLFGLKVSTLNHSTAIFRQVNKDEPRAHHDALEFPDGQIVLLTDMVEGQEATVLQLPAQPMTAAEEKEQERVAYVG